MIDRLLRFLYVLVAPVFLVAFAAIIPMTGVLVGIGIATIVALTGSDRWRARVSRIPGLGKPLANMANLGDYYRNHPPKPLVFYVAYPLLLPYVIYKPELRRELLLYRKVNLVAAITIPLFAGIEFVAHWHNIPFAEFARSMAAALLLQLLVTFALVMPIVTTIVLFHLRGHRKSLVAVLVLSGLATTGMALKARHDHRPSAFVMARIGYRTAKEPARVRVTLQQALATAGSVREHGGTIADAQAAARTQLRALGWPEDESYAFALAQMRDGTLLLVANYKTKHAKPWLARTALGVELTTRDQLTPELRDRIDHPRY